MRSLTRCLTAALLLCAALPAHAVRQDLRNWKIESACKVAAKGAEISTAGYKPQRWIVANVPTTVVAAQLAAGVFDELLAPTKDLYYGMNLRKLPGMGYPVGKMFSNLPMPEDSPYKCSWWYRTEFQFANAARAGSPASTRDRQVWLHFGGINYRANVWLNGKQIADAEHMAGMWREWEYNVTAAVKEGANALAVEVFAQKEDDLGIT